MEFKDNFKILRKKNRLTQNDIAEEFNINHTSVSKWETGNSMPDISILYPLAKLLHVNIETLLGYEEIEDDEKEIDILKHKIDNLEEKLDKILDKM